MFYSFANIAKILGSSVVYNSKIINPDELEHGSHLSDPILQADLINEILTDSRSLLHAESTVFFALITSKNNGHHYIQELISKGVRFFIVQEKYMFEYPQAFCIGVKDTIHALHQLSYWHRNQFNLPVIAITGSNGKTIVKEWLYQLLNNDYHIVRSPKSYNSQIGVPLSVWLMNETHNMGIFEAGISQNDEMSNLETIIKPSIGVFTNIGEAHSEGFQSIASKIQEKLILFKNVSILIYCKDHDLIHSEISKTPFLSSKQAFTWSKHKHADVLVQEISKNIHKTSIDVQYASHHLKFDIPFVDDASIENSIHCLCVMLYLNIPFNTIKNRMLQLASIAMRLEQKEGINNCTIINDSYNSDINSLRIAIDFLVQQQQHKSYTLILSDILQTGSNLNSLYSEVASLLKAKGIQRLIGIGEGISACRNQFIELESSFFANTQEFLSGFHGLKFENEGILIKGARIFEFEKISLILQQKSHQTVFEINTHALIQNLNYFKSKLAKNVKVMAMVKAFSYGTGSFEIANILQYHNIDYLAVAYTDEGMELRKSGITVPIMVMNPEEEAFDNIIKYQLEIEIYSFKVLKSFLKSISAHGITSENPVYIHIKLDTGMHRLGFIEEDLNSLIEYINNNRNIRIKSVFSHLVASDDENEDSFTKGQIALFKKMSSHIEELTGQKFLRHIANSAAASRLTEAQFDMVRLGIGLYGVSGNSNDKKHLQNVCSLKSVISQIKYVTIGDTIGYNRKGKVNKPMKTATIAIGYADGLNRLLSNGKGCFYVKGQKAPIIGNICMDMCMIDISNIDAAEGDEVEIFGKHQSIEHLADLLGTIPYEILTSISRRVKRVYFHE